MTKRADQLLREAAKELQLANKVQRKADDHKWAAAERMWTANKEEGVTLREIAAKLSISKDTASRHVRVWDGRVSGLIQTENFSEAFYVVIGEGPEEREERAVERVARERPEVIAKVLTQHPEAAATVTEHVVEELPQARAAAVRGSERNLARREADGRRKEREALSDETVDDLEYTQELRDREMDLIKARGWLAGFLRNTTAETISDAPESWRESCFRWLDDIEGNTQMARSLLSGENIEEGLRRLLAEEGR